MPEAGHKYGTRSSGDVRHAKDEMRIAHAAVAIAALTALPATAEPLPQIPCDVTGVTDGDSFSAACHAWPGMVLEAKVRVLDIDTPERSWRASCEDEALLADIATEAAEELLGERVVLVVEGRDSFGRILAHVVLEDGRDYGTEMMRLGLALPYSERDRGWCGK